MGHGTDESPVPGEPGGLSPELIEFAEDMIGVLRRGLSGAPNPPLDPALHGAFTNLLDGREFEIVDGKMNFGEDGLHSMTRFTGDGVSALVTLSGGERDDPSHRLYGTGHRVKISAIVEGNPEGPKHASLENVAMSVVPSLSGKPIEGTLSPSGTGFRNMIGLEEGVRYAFRVSPEAPQA